ncbi:glycosyl hydrolase family 8 [Azotobacter beijerinckii]|nr:glycosyl hydrolase family 8 [Azotobacter beijerinckii]
MAVERLGPMAALIALLLLGLPACAAQDDDWSRYRTRYIDGGRVLDTGNRDVSHSEGQGWGMLLAEANGDRQTFDRLWNWTRQHLLRPDIALFSWRYDPSSSPPVQDTNNATDGDLLIAWALLRAAQRWDSDDYRAASAKIRQAIAARLVREYAGLAVLLPGLDGFEQNDQLILNPSYLVMPAIRAFAEVEPQAAWRRLLDDGQTLLERARFGHYRLPPDWLALRADGTLQPAAAWPARFGFDAVRVPLYLAWDGSPPGSASLRPFADFWACCEQPHAWVDLRSGELSPYPASTGVRAIAVLIGEGSALIAFPEKAENEDYYSMSLLLLARLAQRERTP